MSGNAPSRGHRRTVFRYGMACLSRLKYKKKRKADFSAFHVMREMGLEPTRPIGHKILSLACLPISALPQTTRDGIEPTTSAVTGRRSNQLSHRATWYRALKTVYRSYIIL